MTQKKPNSRRNLDLALEREYGRGEEARQPRTAMANAIVGQLLPDDYVMRPFAVKLAYNTKSWVTVSLEVGHDEIGDTAEPEFFISDDIVGMFERLGFDAPAPVALMPPHHQVAQKLHALTGAGSERAHDLVDLQLIAAHNGIDCEKAHDACVRLFSSRREQEWPPVIVEGEGWAGFYEHAREDLPVLLTVSEAVEWGNSLIARIEAAG